MDDPRRPSLDAIVAQADGRPSLDEIIAQADGDPMAKWHRAYQTGRLQKNVADLNAADLADSSLGARFADTATQMGELIASAIPGGKNAIAGGRALNKKPLLTNGRPTVATPAEAAQERRALDESLANTEHGSPRVFGGTGADEGLPIIGKPWNPKLTTLAKTGLTAPMALKLPGTPAQVGATIGGVTGALDSAPDASPGRVLFNTALESAIGSLFGKGAEVGSTWLRSTRTPNASDAVMDIQDARSAADKTNYGSAADQGRRYYADLDAAQAANRKIIRDRMTDVDRIVNQKALPAPGQSHVAKADLAQRRYQANYVEGAPTPTLEQAYRQNYTNALEPQEPFTGPSTHDPMNLMVKDYTNPREIKLRAANDINVRGQAPRGEAPPQESPPVSSLRDVPEDPITPVLDSPGIEPYAKIVRASERFRDADPSTLLRETYKLMSEAQAKKLAVGERGDFAAASDFQLKDLNAAKNRLRAAAKDVMPDFDPAVDTHRIISGELKAQREGYGMAQRLLKGPVTAKNLGNPNKDPRAFLRRTVPSMTPAEAAAAARGTLGSVRESGQGFTINPRKGFGMAKIGETNDFLRALDQLSGNETPVLAQKGFLELLRQSVGQ